MENLNIPVGISDFAQIRQNEYYYVDKSGLISEILKTPARNYLMVWIFQKLQNQQASEVEISRSLQLLLQIMNKYYGKQVILLLDEYDVPLAKASTNNYYEQMLEIIKRKYIYRNQ